MSPNDHERYEILLVKAVDGQLDPTERAQLDAHLDGCPSCQAELSDFQLIKDTTDTMRRRILQDAKLEGPRPTPAARSIIGMGVGLVLVGCALLVGFAAYSIAVAGDVPLVVKMGAATAAVGTLLLLGYVLRIRWRAHGRDPYEEIDQ